MRIALIVVVLLGVAPELARAEDIVSYETEGDADVGGADPRVAALDEAFSRAASAALGELVDADTRKANKAAINRDILGRARLWVAKFTVTKDETADGRRQLTVVVRVDRDKMRDKLSELNIATSAAPGQPAPGARPVVILLRTVDGTTVRASYGATAEKELPGLGALASALRGGGMTIKRAPAAGPAARSTGELPLDDDEAEALAGDAKAEVAVIAGVTIGAPVPIRGVAAPAVLVTAHLRLVGRGRQLLGQGTASVAARGQGSARGEGMSATVIGAAIDRALVAAASDAVPPARPALDRGPALHGEDVPIGEPGVVLVRLAPKTPWGLVSAEQKYLAGAKGVQRAMLRRVSPAGWVIGVTTTESIDRIMQITRRAPAPDASVKSSKVVGDIVELALAGAP